MNVERPHTPGCCNDGSCNEQTCMQLPQGNTCGNCIHADKCTALFGATTTNTTCEFFPRRFQGVPFEASFQERRDDQLDEKLADELPGILAWAVRGCLDWLADGGGLAGLGDSPSIAEAT